jgi:hypothetical protein
MRNKAKTCKSDNTKPIEENRFWKNKLFLEKYREEANRKINFNFEFSCLNIASHLSLILRRKKLK